MTRYAKAVATFLGALSTWGVTAAADGRYDQVELWGLAGVLGATLLAYNVPNVPPRGHPSDPGVSETDPQRAG